MSIYHHIYYIRNNKLFFYIPVYIVAIAYSKFIIIISNYARFKSLYVHIRYFYIIQDKKNLFNINFNF